MEFWIDILMHTSFFLLFLPTFYFYYVAPLQSYSIIDDLFEIIQPDLVNFSLMTSLNDTKTLNKVIELIAGLSTNNSGIDDATRDITNSNKTIYNLTNIICYTIGGFLFCLGIVLAYLNNSDIFSLLLSNVIVLSFIIVSEFAIVGLFFKNFKEINGNFIKATISQFLLLPYTPSSSPNDSYYYDRRCDYTSRFMGGILPEWFLKFFTS